MINWEADARPESKKIVSPSNNTSGVFTPIVAILHYIAVIFSFTNEQKNTTNGTNPNPLASDLAGVDSNPNDISNAEGGVI
ncbi:hypothetical protein [Candidatus Tisiphia endosymbiont of Nemotelus uliginosus]|uniref:hypothetical protein n=1 Tax=Candidatus Tisiphia endosymbiont of Nemotelus uliginosus TaxID=3077926 RepID=UPI0035C9304D